MRSLCILRSLANGSHLHLDHLFSGRTTARAMLVRRLGFGSHVSDNDPEVIQREKERSLKGECHTVIKEFPGWNSQLASDSEEVVKAEKAGAINTEEMQAQTTRMILEVHHEELLTEIQGEDTERTTAGGGAPFRGNQTQKPAMKDNINYSGNSP